MTDIVTQQKHGALRGRFIQLGDPNNEEIESALPSIALVYFEGNVDEDSFIETVKNLLNNGVESFCLSGKKASHLEDIVDDEIINGKFEKGTLFRRKSILTSFHEDESIEDIALYIETQVRLNKLNPIVNVIYDKPSETLSGWKAVLCVV